MTYNIIDDAFVNACPSYTNNMICVSISGLDLIMNASM